MLEELASVRSEVKGQIEPGYKEENSHALLQSALLTLFERMCMLQLLSFHHSIDNGNPVGIYVESK